MRSSAYIVVAFVGGICLSTLDSGAAVIVAPGDLATVEGDARNLSPFFGGYPTAGSSQRYQQVFASSDFDSLDAPLLITAITFRPDKDQMPFLYTHPDIQINLSTTTSAPDFLDATFADNVGTDDTIVVNRGPLTLSSLSTGPVGGAMTFDIVVPFETPFLYDPEAGNLLLEVRRYVGSGVEIFLDASISDTDTVSRAFGSPVDTSTASNVSTTGVVAQFTFNLVGAVEVALDIKPGSDTNCFNQNGHGVIPVAVFGSGTLDVNDIDVASLLLQGLPVKMAGKSNKYLAHIDYVDGDGYPDLAVQFQDDYGWIDSGEDIAILTGRLLDGTPIEGSVKI